MGKFIEIQVSQKNGYGSHMLMPKWERVTINTYHITQFSDENESERYPEYKLGYAPRGYAEIHVDDYSGFNTNVLLVHPADSSRLKNLLLND